MKRWKSLTAALCAAVLLCGFSAVPAFAYADGGEGENYGDPTMTEETTAPEPEPTIEPGEGFSEEGNLVTRDLLYDEHTNKQFITVQTSGGNTFYIVIDSISPWTRTANSTKHTFSALWTRPICWLLWKPPGWKSPPVPVRISAWPGPSTPIAPYAPPT